MGQRARTDLQQFLLHLSREPADRLVIEPLGNGPLLSLFQPFDRALLLLEIAFILNLGFDGFEFVANFGGKTRRGFARIFADSSAPENCDRWRFAR